MAAELGRFADGRRRRAVEALLCAPFLQHRVWNWNAGQVVPVWVFALVPGRELVLAYSTAGYGDPWGLLDVDDDSLGMDSQWYLYLEDAAADGGVGGPPPPGFQIR